MNLCITDIVQETPGVKTFTLSPALPYRAGQFLSFDFEAVGIRHRRSYSLSSAPGADDAMQITVKRVANGLMSRWMIDDARPGDVLQYSGEATGLFTLPDHTDKIEAFWFFAAGIGITPIFSLLKSLLHNTDFTAVLVYSNHDMETTVFHESLRELERRSGSRLTIVWLWGNAKDLRRARFSKDYFPQLKREYLTQDASSVFCYTCGPPDYMWLVQLLLQDTGVPPQQVRREVFLVNKEIAHYLPADKASHQVTVHFGNRSYSFTNAYPQSILASAKATGIHLPYSCETGQCGSCTATCIDGKVWMSYNEVLTDSDLTSGLILTCTGHAIDGDVRLQF